MCKMKFQNIITELGLIKGREAIDFVKFNVLTESKIDIILSIDTTKCSPVVPYERYVNMRVKSNSLIYFKMQSDELLPKLHPESCICEILDSQIVKDNSDLQPNLKHIVLTSYDSIFEIVCSDIEFSVE